MWRHELRVKQGKAARPQPMHQIGQRDFGGVGAAREHAFAEKRRPQSHSVDPADQVIA
jgi:hypothetical protein